MCGLIGMFSKELLTRVELNALKELFMVTQLRGIDSTGLLHADLLYKREYYMEKEAGSFLALTENHPDSLQSLRGNFVMGHCRYATKGSVTSDNAHPYVFDKIVGMHNGTLSDRKYDPDSLDLPRKDRGKFTDSYLFFRELNKVIKSGGSVDDLIKDMRWTSAYAMVFWDLMSKVSLFRNSDRTLFIGVEKSNGTVVLSSEERFIRLISTSKIDFEITKVETDTLYEINLKEIGSSKTPWTTSALTKQKQPETFYSGVWDDFDYGPYRWDKNKQDWVYTKKELEDAGQGSLL